MGIKIIRTNDIFQGKVFAVQSSTIEIFPGKTIKRDVVIHKGAVGIIPLLSRNKIILLKQYRFPVNKVIYEIPAGTLEEGETALNCAKRELEEETGYKARKMIKILEFHTAPGYSTEKLHLFLATNLTKGKFSPEADESMKIEIFTLKEAYQLLKKGKIVDAKSIIALLYLKLKGYG